MMKKKGVPDMKNRGLSQEGLKLIACLTMLIDHIGAVFFSWVGLRVIGRIAFPIYCFLLAEGAYYTRSRKEYAIRLMLGLFLSEIPFDLLFFGQLTLAHQSVMVTLLLGYLYAVAMNYIPSEGYRILLLLPFAMLAELLNCDYGGWGVVMIGLFVITRVYPRKEWIQVVLLGIISWMIGGVGISFGFVTVPIQVFSVLAMVPICLYNGTKHTNNLWVRRGFYLFYPAHLLLLYLIRGL